MQIVSSRAKRAKLVSSILVVLCLSSCGGGGGSGGSAAPPPPPPPPPPPTSANAGADQVVLMNTTATLDGAASSGDIATYAWSQLSGIAVNLINSDAENASFDVPDVDEREVLEFQLSVTSSSGQNDSDQVVITINVDPTADAGRDLTTHGLALVQLNGAVSYDVDGEISSYSWEQTEGIPVAIEDESAAETQFVAPNATIAEELRFQLTATDNDGASTTDDVVITVEPPSPSETDFGIVSLTFLKLPTEEGHGDYFPISGSPTSGPSEIRLATTGAIDSLRLRISDTSGVEIATYEASTDGPFNPPFVFEATANIPSEPFTIEAFGELRDGTDFTAQWVETIIPQSVSLVCQPEKAIATPEESLSIRCELSNSGPDDTFDLVFDDPESMVQFTSGQELSVLSGSSEYVDVDVVVPLSTERFRIVQVTVIATGRMDAARANESVIELWVE